MRREALFFGALTTLGAMAPGTAVVMPNAVASATASTSAPSTSALAASLAGMSSRSKRFVGGGSAGYGFIRPTYRKRPHGSVARDKRDATKRRNQLRNKR